MSLSRQHIAILLLAIFYTVGIIGLSMEASRESFLRLTPFNLLLTMGLLTWGNGDYSRGYLLGFVIAFLIGFWVEVAGVHTGVLFGVYSYGEALGWKWLDVPLMIGVNWFLLAFAAMGSIAFVTRSFWPAVILSSLLMVGLDVLIEPVAIELGFWSWEAVAVPFRNYVMWFVVSLVIQVLLHKVTRVQDRGMALAVLASQFVFFGILNLV